MRLYCPRQRGRRSRVISQLKRPQAASHSVSASGTSGSADVAPSPIDLVTFILLTSSLDNSSPGEDGEVSAVLLLPRYPSQDTRSSKIFTSSHGRARFATIQREPSRTPDPICKLPCLVSDATYCSGPTASRGPLTKRSRRSSLSLEKIPAIPRAACPICIVR